MHWKPFSVSSLILVLGVRIGAEQTGHETSGCGKAPPESFAPLTTSQNISITSGGLDRSILLHLPPNYDANTPAPLILSFHGREKNASEQELLSQFSNASFNPHAIAVYPQGVAVSQILCILYLSFLPLCPSHVCSIYKMRARQSLQLAKEKKIFAEQQRHPSMAG
jgi:poly(3-hydroxybutyrate) depolymerase